MSALRGLYSSKTKIRNQIFTEVARFAYEGGDYSKFENLPYEIIPGEISTYRESIFLERAIVGERLRLAMGLPLLPVSKQAPISTGVEESMIDEKVYDPPLINIIKFACHKCAEKRVVVTDGCQGCLEHPCTEVCPKGAISIVHGKSHIDDEKCIKYGKSLIASLIISTLFFSLTPPLIFLYAGFFVGITKISSNPNSSFLPVRP